MYVGSSKILDDCSCGGKGARKEVMVVCEGSELMS